MIAIGFLLLVSLAVTVVSVLVGIVVTTGLFALLFRFLPDVRLRWPAPEAFAEKAPAP